MRRSCLSVGIIFSMFVSPFVAMAQRGLVEKPIPDLHDSYQAQLTLVFDLSLARPHKLTPAEKKEVDETDGVTITYPLEVKLDRSGEYFVVRCDSGGSDDFGCAFLAMDNTFDYKTSYLPGLRFEIPGDNCVYASGHNDTMFNLRRKFCVDEGRLKEVKQPLHYVGLQSKTARDLTFYSDMTMKTPVGTIPRGEFIEVLVANVDQDSTKPGDLPVHNPYLVRDKRGLTGWVKLEETREAEDVEGLFFAGD